MEGKDEKIRKLMRGRIVNGEMEKWRNESKISEDVAT